MKRKLNEENINISCEEADSFLRKRKTDSKDRIRMMLSMEETLLKYKDSFGADSEYIVDFGSGFHRNRIRLTVPGRELYDSVYTAVSAGVKYRNHSLTDIGFGFYRNSDEYLYRAMCTGTCVQGIRT